MRLELVYSAAALADFEAILLYIALDNPRAARQWVADIESVASCSASFPNSAWSGMISFREFGYSPIDGR